MRCKYSLLLIIAVVLFSCKKENGKGNPLPSSPPPAQPVLLKEIMIPFLPSPFYHFEYNEAGKVSFISYASGLYMYNIVYDGNKISEVKNNIVGNKDKLQYFYDNADNLSTVTYADSNGLVYKKIDFSYDGQKLIQLKREGKRGAGFIMDKTMTMSYHADGNLKDLTYHYPAINGQPEHSYTDRFEQYDNKVNADGFGLIHNDFFDHLVFLPGVQLQKNNARKVTRSGDAWNYAIDYRYTYNDHNAPLEKSGEMIVTSGPDSGKVFHLSSTFSYYQ